MSKNIAKRKKRKHGSLMSRLLSMLIPYAIAAIAVVWIGLPIMYAVLWSLVNPEYPWSYPDVFPQHVGFYQWERVFKYTNILSAVKNSVIIALVVTLLCIVIAFPTAYAIGRRPVKGKGVYKIVMLIPLIFPGMALAMFLGRFFNMVGLSQKFAGVILAHTLVCLPYQLRILTSSFEGMSQDLIDAADNLGAGNRTKIFELYIPTVMPGITAGAIFTFIESMQEFNLAYIIGTPTIETVPTILFAFMGNNFQRTAASVVTLILLVPNMIMLLLTDKFIKTEHLGAALGKM